ncbi:MAG: hypothetical protein PHU91_04235 [Candidatus Omnitrophica bacterium]|nr:hypothetical protein [Candidatus Omnitrophota bacterium]MDD5236850.1 hypothetical protein [Candidatus Omnitrophota bacterium]MDD5610784.1 hypothetical protein [Candidatus Omnitrophota bacterium]
MVKNIDHEQRKRDILTATINRYIQEAIPVASDDLAEDFELSSATIRNAFADLEKDGFLMHPYTSGGRIPTNKGYRYYVDFLLSQMELVDAEKEQIIREYKEEIRRLEDALEKTSQIISEITQYTGIVSFLEWQDKLFYKGMSLVLEQPEFRDYEKMRLLIRMIEDKKRLIDIINRDFSGTTRVYIGEELGCPEMDNCSLIVSSYQFKDKPSGRVAVLGPKRMKYKHTISALEYISDILQEVLNKI